MSRSKRHKCSCPMCKPWKHGLDGPKKGAEPAILLLDEFDGMPAKLAFKFKFKRFKLFR